MFWQNLFQKIIAAIKETLEVTLPELAADIIDRGIYLAGGSSQLRGLPELISKETKMRCIFLKSRLIVWLWEHQLNSEGHNNYERPF